MRNRFGVRSLFVPPEGVEMTITHPAAGSRALTREDRSGVSRDLLPRFAAATAHFAARAQLNSHLSDEVSGHRPSDPCSPATLGNGAVMPP